MKDVCKRFSIDSANVNCELDKIQLFESGSAYVFVSSASLVSSSSSANTTGQCFTNSQSGSLEKERSFRANHIVISIIDGTNTFGSVELLLPSQFSGADIEVSHDGRKRCINLSNQSGLCTSLVASYAGPLHRISPVKTGYRISILYKLKHSLDQERPTLPDTHFGRLGPLLRDILTNWITLDISGGSPNLIGILLRQTYPISATFSSSSLRGADELLLESLYPLASTLGFQLHLAQVQHELSTPIQIEKAPYNDDRGGSNSGGHAGLEEECSDVPEDCVHIRQITDLDGMPVHVQGLKLTLKDMVTSNGPLNERDVDSQRIVRGIAVRSSFTRCESGLFSILT